MCVARRAQMTQNNKFIIFLYQVEKEVSNAVYFLYVDKYEGLLQIDTKVFWWKWSSIPKIPKIPSLQCLNTISKKKLEMKLTF